MKTPEIKNRNPSFKAPLDLKMIKGLSLNAIPTGYSLGGKLDFVENVKVLENGTQNPGYVDDYIIWDSHRDAPRALAFESQEERLT
jgi:hypothetical protein